MSMKLNKRIVTLALTILLGCYNAQACENIKIDIDNQSKESIYLLGEKDAPVEAVAGKKQQLELPLRTYKDKFCSVVELSFQKDGTTDKYVVQPKQKNFSINVEDEQKLDIKGLTGPLKY